MLPVVAVADAEIAVVEDHRVHTCLCEGLRIGRHHDFAYVAPATRKHDRGAGTVAVGLVEPGTDRRPFRLEFDVEPANHTFSSQREGISSQAQNVCKRLIRKQPRRA